ncbi:MAG: hypothetical protein V1726_02430 [Methanobacteriota archaeon]
MKKQITLLTILTSCFLLSVSFFTSTGSCCKDVIACGDATAGPYNLLLKVRDPSRPGLQILCHVPANYTYTYQHPWTGAPLTFTTTHSYIGVATLGDTLPNIVKAGMMITDAGLAFGDADTDSNWKNPSRNAWDDFDWLRYAGQQADDENEAITLLTKDVVDELHASAVSENLFLVGPNKSAIIEADAYHYHTEELTDGVRVMSNYPIALWQTQIHKKLPIASSFNSQRTTTARQGDVIRLGSLYGVKIMRITKDHIILRQIPALKIDNRLQLPGTPVVIQRGERKTVGDYSVTVLAVLGKYARVHISTVYQAWEHELLKQLEPHYGSLTVQDMMNLSRLHTEDLQGLRPLCEDLFPYESALISKIPEEHSNVFSSGWFAANHACSSIYVPIHILDTDIYTPYTTGEAAQLSLDLLQIYGHGTLIIPFSNLEKIFLNETTLLEHLAQNYTENTTAVSQLFTIADTAMQQQAYLTEQLWRDNAQLPDSLDTKNLYETLVSLWGNNYTTSLINMEHAVDTLKNNPDTQDQCKTIQTIALTICNQKIAINQHLHINTTHTQENYHLAENSFTNQEYTTAFSYLHQTLQESDTLLHSVYP